MIGYLGYFALFLKYILCDHRQCNPTLTEARVMFQTEGVLWDRVQGSLWRSSHPSPPLQALLSEEARNETTANTG